MSDSSLTVAEVAARLGVRRETVYAYVSRGVLNSRRTPGRRESRFDPAEVDRLAARTRRASERAVEATGGPSAGTSGGPAIETALTLIEDHHLYYRGRDVAELARVGGLERVAWWLWTGADGEPEPATWAAPSALLDQAGRAVSTLPEDARGIDRLRVGVAAMSTVDPWARDLRPEGVATTGRGLLAAMVDSLPRLDGAGAAGGSGLAWRLWPRLSPLPATEAAVGTLDAALILLADHDLAASTFAARVAASTGADPYAVALAGLGALDGPRHGAASVPAHRMLRAVEAEFAAGVGTAPADVLAGEMAGGYPPGFGHPLYPVGDPRAKVLLDLLGTAATTDGLGARAAERWRTVGEVRDLAEQRSLLPNVDFALAALAFLAELRDGMAETVFAVARIVGWLGHAIEEYAVDRSRFRPRGRYVGEPPAGANR